MPAPSPVLVQKAFEFLKKRDFKAALAVMAGLDRVDFESPHFLIKGLSELALEDWAAAATTFTAAAARFPDDALFWLNKGIAEENLGLTDLAVESQQRCLSLKPDQAEAAGNLANLYRKQKNFEKSEQMARRALELGAPRADALNSLALALGKLARHDEAESVFAEALQVEPCNAFVLLNRANLAVDRFRFDEAWDYFAKARAVSDLPVIRRDEGLARLLYGDFERGWELSEARLAMPHALRVKPPCPLWRGEDIAGKKLLILAEQGFGDVIQFCRYQEFLSPDAELVWAVPKVLVRLLSGAMKGTVMYENDPLPGCDFYVAMMSLPFLIRDRQQKINGIPAFAGMTVFAEPSLVKETVIPAPYPDTKQAQAGISFSKYLCALSEPKLPPGRHAKKIGLVWAGSRTHERDHERSIKLTMLEPLLRNVEADFYAPFVGDALDEIGDLPVTRLDSLCGDFADAAALIAQMDWVITVDTALAHLAGALGVKTFVLLPYCPDWRWGMSGETSAWYPSLTLLRQAKHGDWQSVIELLERRFREAA